MQMALTFSGRKRPKGEWSDTRAMAWIAGNWGLDVLTDLLAPSLQKLAIMTPEKVFYFPEGSWHKKDGYAQSSSTFRMPKFKGKKYDFSNIGDWPEREADPVVKIGRVRQEPTVKPLYTDAEVAEAIAALEAEVKSIPIIACN